MKFEKLVKEFESFHEGILELAEMSYSVEQVLLGCITKNQVEDFIKKLKNQSQYSFPEVIDNEFLPKVVSTLAVNAVYGSRIEINAGTVEYETTGGLVFGWDSEYNFHIQHPSGKFKEDSTLFQAGRKMGWKLE